MRDNVTELTAKVRALQSDVWWIYLFAVLNCFALVANFGAFLAIVWKMKETL